MKKKLTKAQLAEDLKQHRERARAGYKTVRDINNAEASICLQLLQHCSRDIWGSADLHFDGDCFQEHEWHVVMRGGGIHQGRHFASGKTAVEALMAAFEKKFSGDTLLIHFKHELQALNELREELNAKENKEMRERFRESMKS